MLLLIQIVKDVPGYKIITSWCEQMLMVLVGTKRWCFVRASGSTFPPRRRQELVAPRQLLRSNGKPLDVTQKALLASIIKILIIPQ